MIFHRSSASETSSYITQPDSLPSGVLIGNGSSRPSDAESEFHENIQMLIIVAYEWGIDLTKELCV